MLLLYSLRTCTNPTEVRDELLLKFPSSKYALGLHSRIYVYTADTNLSLSQEAVFLFY